MLTALARGLSALGIRIRIPGRGEEKKRGMKMNENLEMMRKKMRCNGKIEVGIPQPAHQL